MKWQFGEPISQRSAAISGALFGTAFPKSYLKHVPANNGGCPEKRFFDTKTTKGRVVAYFLSTKMELEDPESLFHYARNDKAYFEKVAPDKESFACRFWWNGFDLTGRYLPFAVDVFGNLLCFRLSENPSIVLIEHESMTCEEVSDSFEEFMRGLYHLTEQELYMLPWDSDAALFTLCQQQLSHAVKTKEDLGKRFSMQQLQQIEKGLLPKGFVWHKTSDGERMELVPSKEHRQIYHALPRSEKEKSVWDVRKTRGTQLKSTERVHEVSRLVNYVFTPAYAKVAVEYNGADFLKTRFKSRNGEEHEVTHLLSFNKEDADTVWQWLHVEEGALLATITKEGVADLTGCYFPFACDEAGNVVAFCMKDDRVVFLDCQTGEVQEVAAGFSEFLAGLYSAESTH